MSNKWFRLYSEILHDPKVQIVTEALRWRYVALLCLHCEENYENRPDDEIALALRVTLEDWEFTRNEFIKRGLLSKDGKINGWEKRQYISDIKDPTAAERQKRYRINKRNNCNGSVTQPVTSRLPDSESDTERKKNKQKENFIPPDWIPQTEWQAWLKIRKKNSNTPEALMLAIKKLEALKAEGHSPKDVLEQSVMGGYQGIFSPKDGQRKQDIPWNLRPENRMPSPAGG